MLFFIIVLSIVHLPRKEVSTWRWICGWRFACPKWGNMGGKYFLKLSSFYITLKAALELVNARLVRPIGIADFKRALKISPTANIGQSLTNWKLPSTSLTKWWKTLSTLKALFTRHAHRLGHEGLECKFSRSCSLTQNAYVWYNEPSPRIGQDKSGTNYVLVELMTSTVTCDILERWALHHLRKKRWLQVS